ncbi:hypothetical protein EV702DRAFT_731739 [Suillus placidus]|uniref:Uncharacterized protein n=1 Tax=Suillus placidus TaxID=48579 RepID=A0A9P7A2M8_9AGAM|nr:hypothetical protein EV702DRAFT_731739 [Suillus placidus]
MRERLYSTASSSLISPTQRSQPPLDTQIHRTSTPLTNKPTHLHPQEDTTSPNICPSTHRVSPWWPASAWNKLNFIAAASKYGAYPARARSANTRCNQLDNRHLRACLLLHQISPMAGNMYDVLTRCFSCSCMMCRRDSRGGKCGDDWECYFGWNQQLCLPAMHLFNHLLPFSSHKADLTVPPLHVQFMRAVTINASLSRISVWCECELIRPLQTAL